MTTTNTPQLSPVKQIESLYVRLEKARSIFAAGKVHKVLGLDEHYVVESSKGDGFYQVNGTCTCGDAQNRTALHHGWCCHKLAVEIYKDQHTIAETPKVNKAVNNASTTPPETDRPLEDLLEDLYPKAKKTDSLK